jgi:hypothetical protein
MQTETDRGAVILSKLANYVVRLTCLVLMVLSTFYWKEPLQFAFWTVLYVFARLGGIRLFFYDLVVKAEKIIEDLT